MSSKRRDQHLLARIAIASAILLALGAAMSCDSGDGGEEPSAPLADGSPGGDDVQTDTAPTRAPYGLDTRPANPTCKAPAPPPSNSPIKFEPAFENVQLLDPI